MSLYERLHEVQRSDFPEFSSGRDPVLDELRQRVHHLLIDEVGPLLYDRRIGEDELRRQLQEHLKVILGREKVPLSTADRTQLVQDLTDDVLGYGPISGLLADPDVNEVMCNGPSHVYVERHGKIVKSGASFIDENHLKRIIEKIVAQVGRRVDESNPMVDARLPDGSRVNAVIAPLAIGGPFLTIRKFAKDPFTVEDLINFGSFSRTVAQFLDACVKGRLNVIVSGGTGTGKTTALNVLSSFIPHDERIVTVEDAKELQLHQEHVLSLESRPPNIEGKGEVRIRDLVRNTLRDETRPDRGGGVPRRRGPRHAAGHEHRPRRVDHHGALQLAARHAGPHRDHGADGRDGPAGAGHPRADGIGHRPHRAPDPPPGRNPARHPCQ
jgi:pilus assembly protein CpaF